MKNWKSILYYELLKPGKTVCAKLTKDIINSLGWEVVLYAAYSPDQLMEEVEETIADFIYLTLPLSYRDLFVYFILNCEIGEKSTKSIFKPTSNISNISLR